MCGIAGFLTFEGFSASDAETIVNAQNRVLAHRGPDDVGQWMDAAAGIALAHRRLSILDLSPAGHQPMMSASGRYIIILNGEIYNHLEIRAQLTDANCVPEWRGHSDTETLVESVDRWGVEDALKVSVGMYAFALWDRRERVLTLARDRMGEKPLYYGWHGNSLLFGSELKALRAHPGFRSEIDREVLSDYLSRGYIPTPRSIYRGTLKVPPGTFVQFSANQGKGAVSAPKTYWSVRDAVERGRSNPFRGDDEEAADNLEEVLGRATALQSIADVSLGAFLSGGIDSSLIVALMQARSSQSVKTFTIGFKVPTFDEARHARAVAAHLGTDHTDMYVDVDEAMRVIPILPRMFDEPFGDSSAIPTYLVSHLARSKVTVSLSGDGGDELFGGYSRYQRTLDIWGALRRIPAPLRASLAFGTRAVDRLARLTAMGPKVGRLSQYLETRDPQQCYELQILNGSGLSAAVLDAPTPSVSGQWKDIGANAEILDQMMYEDSCGYLPDDILTKVDRASMAVSLESRVPMLDHRVVEFAWRLPLQMKRRHNEGKWLLKKVLRRHVPAYLVDRKKMGFGVPVADWIRGPLRSWAEELLSTPRLERQGLLNEQVVRAHWHQFLAGGRVGGDGIWPLLMFQSWLGD